MSKHTTNGGESPNPKDSTTGEDKSGRVLVSGSFCYDVIFDCAGGLETAAAGAVFFAPDVRRVFGGCGGNIAFGLAQLGDAPLLVAAAGKDWGDYQKHLAQHNIGDRHILVRDDCWTAMAFVINDDKGGQMTVFHPGASVHAHRQNIGDIGAEFALAIVSPNAGAAMMKHCRELSGLNVPFVFDPGQALGLLNAEELRESLTLCACAIFNAGEFSAALATLGEDKDAAARYAGAVIVTDGERGAELLQHSASEGAKSTKCPAAILGKTADTTGCGDAYRAGLLHGMLRGWQWQKRMQFAAIIAGIKAQSYGGQQYQTTAAEAETLRQKTFN